MKFSFQIPLTRGLDHFSGKPNQDRQKLLIKLSSSYKLPILHLSACLG